MDKPDARLGEAAEKTTETKVLEDGSTAYTDLAMCFKLMVEEYGELSESHAKAYHQCGRALLAWSRMEGKAFKHAMSGFNLNVFDEPKVEVEDTNNLAHDKRLEIEDGISETLDKNYNTQKTPVNATTMKFPTLRKSLQTRIQETPRLARTRVRPRPMT